MNTGVELAFRYVNTRIVRIQPFSLPFRIPPIALASDNIKDWIHVLIAEAINGRPTRPAYLDAHPPGFPQEFSRIVDRGPAFTARHEQGDAVIGNVSHLRIRVDTTENIDANPKGGCVQPVVTQHRVLNVKFPRRETSQVV